eukprot:GEZU01012162.1.p2 GENE.GEZU01012162.1~~GEZU01012162.1.p2  ORF type:complete len:103 (-),score=25.62 GEZU01012162.1:76-384(-)
MNEFLSIDFRERLRVKESKVAFRTHRELDRFVARLVERMADFQERYPQHWSLLKSFDRAFWLRSYKFPEEEAYACERGGPKQSVLCPFSDPQETMSFKKEWF